MKVFPKELQVQKSEWTYHSNSLDKTNPYQILVYCLEKFRNALAFEVSPASFDENFKISPINMTLPEDGAITMRHSLHLPKRL